MPVPTESYLNEFLYGELVDVVGPENVSATQSDKIAYSCDYYWIPELWLDRGRPLPGRPSSTPAEEVRASAALPPTKVPLTTWGGSGYRATRDPRRHPADTKKPTALEIDKTSLTVTAETGSSCSTEWALGGGPGDDARATSISCASGRTHRDTLSTKYGKIGHDHVARSRTPDRTIINTLAVPGARARPEPVVPRLRGDARGNHQGDVEGPSAPRVRRFHAFVFPICTPGGRARLRSAACGRRWSACTTRPRPAA